jgi:hypothetical protein
MFGEWEERELGPETVVITVHGKLRGSRARQLGEHLSGLPHRRAPARRVILDLRQVVTIDSLGTQAIEDARDAGLEVALLACSGLELDDGRPVRELSREGLSVHPTLDGAITALGVSLVAS